MSQHIVSNNEKFSNLKILRSKNERAKGFLWIFEIKTLLNIVVQRKSFRNEILQGKKFLFFKRRKAVVSAYRELLHCGSFNTLMPWTKMNKSEKLVLGLQLNKLSVFKFWRALTWILEGRGIIHEYRLMVFWLFWTIFSNQWE